MTFSRKKRSLNKISRKYRAKRRGRRGFAKMIGGGKKHE